MHKTAERNHKMLEEFKAGRTIQELSEDYGLSIASISPILTGERHRRELSPHPFYRDLRDASRSFLDNSHEGANIAEAPTFLQ